jgi:hypothetical protein
LNAIYGGIYQIFSRRIMKMFFSEKDVTELNSSMSNMQNSNTEAKESEEDYEWEVIYEDNCDKWDCAFKICFERKKKEVAKDN